MAYILKNANDEPILKDGSGIFMTNLNNVVKSVDMKKRTLDMVGSDETADRDGDIVMVSGWDLQNFLMNPVFLWSHQHSGPESVPLARAIKVIKRRSPARLDFTMQFPTEGINPFADMILALYGEKVINASSVGFMPKEWEPVDGSGNDGSAMFYYAPKRFLKQELLELSGCAVPCNPMALQNAIKGFMHPQTPKEKQAMVYNWMLGKSVVNAKEIGIDETELAGEFQDLTCEVEEDTSVQVQVPVQLDVIPPVEGVDNTDKTTYNNNHEIKDGVDAVSTEVKDPTDGFLESIKATVVEAVAKGVCGARGLATSDEASWDGAAARASLEAYAKNDAGEIDFGKYKKGFVYQDPAADAKTKGAYKMPFAKAADGKLTATWGGVKAAMGAVLGARGGAQLGDAKRACYNFLKSYYNALDKPAPDFHAFDEEGVVTVAYKFILVGEEDNITCEFEPVDLKDLEAVPSVEGKLALVFGDNITLVDAKEFAYRLMAGVVAPSTETVPPAKTEESKETPLTNAKLIADLKRLAALLPEVK